MWCYVFWHAPRPTTARSAYERALNDFHRALGLVARDAGLELVSGSARVMGLPWRPGGTATYEDRYTVRSLADLERLERLAVEGAMGPSHGRVAAGAGDGQGGLYRTLAGEGVVAGPWATWLAKPDGVAYAAFEADLLAAAARVRGALLRRALVLSPAPEYLLVSARPPAPIAAALVRVRARAIVDDPDAVPGERA